MSTAQAAAPASRQNLLERLTKAEAMLLDGPTGTALESRGFRSHPSLWTASAVEVAPALLSAVHDEYLQAGAEIITANTFRTTAFATVKAGLRDPEATARRWLFSSVALAHACAVKSAGSRFVVGSLAPLADCYRPQETPDDDILRSAHRRTADWLVEAGCDGILVETQGCLREARIAVEAAVAAAAGAIPVLVSFLLDATGAQLLGGGELFTAAELCLLAGASALLVNCGSCDVLLSAIEVLRPFGARGIPLGAYPNVARLQVANGAVRWQADATPIDLAAAGLKLRHAGARILGACCGYSAPDLAALSLALREAA